ncbi:hypothetical protein SD961_14160 [Erwinia sp. MMLR14_017]|uniref:hypothetical protein n=1 Tax=Erwinia sp. MMLR14_017 TaxID=3093842 RepID=UPI00298FC9C6|nr:hypothetical protein [Erwinia sp. MMLR14_017]MDW8847014.1 hypothetical protein [Erwinia sp. MMLR14_017]
MTYGKAGWLLPALMIYAVGVGAATPEEVERFETAQPPGTVSICRGEGSLQAGIHRMTLRNYVRKTVLSVRNGRLRTRDENVTAADGLVYARYIFETVSWLDEDAEVSEIDPDSIRVTLPTSETEAGKIARFVRAIGTQRLQFEDVDASHFPEWDVAPARDDPTGMRYHCGPEGSAG